MCFNLFKYLYVLAKCWSVCLHESECVGVCVFECINHNKYLLWNIAIRAVAAYIQRLLQPRSRKLFLDQKFGKFRLAGLIKNQLTKIIRMVFFFFLHRTLMLHLGLTPDLTWLFHLWLSLSLVCCMLSYIWYHSWFSETSIKQKYNLSCSEI